MTENEARPGWGDLAHAIMGVLNAAPTAMTPAQVRDALGDDLAYTTVMTVLARLHGRGVLARRRVGRAFAYTPTGDPAQVTARRMHRLLEVDTDRAGVLARFVDGLTADDERVLRNLLTEATRDQGADERSAGS